jgi:hypothetical protein
MNFICKIINWHFLILNKCKRHVYLFYKVQKKLVLFISTGTYLRLLCIGKKSVELKFFSFILLRRKSDDSYLLLDWWVFANPSRLINRSVFLYFDAQESSACSVCISYWFNESNDIESKQTFLFTICNRLEQEEYEKWGENQERSSQECLALQNAYVSFKSDLHRLWLAMPSSMMATYIDV